MRSHLDATEKNHTSHPRVAWKIEIYPTVWHMRWAMPTYDKMLESVQKAKGIDITKEDIDLLPWSCLWNRKEFQQEYERLQAVKFNELNLQREAAEAERRRQQEELRKQRELELAAEQRQRVKEEAERQEAKRKAEELARKLEEDKRRREEAERKRQQEEADRRQKELELLAEQKAREEAAHAKALADAKEAARKKALADAEKAAREAERQKELEAKAQAQAQAEENRKRAQEIADRNRRHKVLEYDLARANEQREKSYSECRAKNEMIYLSFIRLTLSHLLTSIVWYARMGQPNREKMKRLVRNLPPSNDDITEDDVDLLPWQMLGSKIGNHLSVKKMNELISKKQMTDDDLAEVFGRVRIEVGYGDED